MQHTHADHELEPPEPVHIDQLLNRAVILAIHSKQMQNRAYNPSVHTDYGVNLAPVKAIPSSLIRAFINLIDNACDAMQLKQHQQQANQRFDYRPTLSIKAQPVGHGIEIRIRDNGCGIAPSIKDKILDPFFTTKAPGQGTGLGLSITYDIIVQQHQGTLTVQTKISEFTEFILNLPTQWIYGIYSIWLSC